MDALAAVEDIDLGGRELSDADKDRAERLLAQASARFRREARQQFTTGESAVRLRVTDRTVYLPQWPANDVLGVIDDTGAPVAWSRIPEGGQTIRLDVAGELTIRPGLVVTPPGGSRVPAFVTVNYTHGGEVPAGVVGAVAAAVGRVLNADPDAAQGVAQATDTRGPFSRTRQFASWAVGGQLLLSPDDLALARSYRPRSPRLLVMRP